VSQIKVGDLVEIQSIKQPWGLPRIGLVKQIAPASIYETAHMLVIWPEGIPIWEAARRLTLISPHRSSSL